MNSKKKNKQKQHKPPTPQPKTEDAEVLKEKPDEIVDVPEKSEVKSEERVPEIVSEVVQPILEAKSSESEAPKKPKRNRGKKKKGDKDDDADDFQEKDQPDVEDSKVTELQGNKDIKVTEKPPVTPEMTPVARKKKNKNKKNAEQHEKPTEQVEIAPVKQDVDMDDLKIVTVVPVTETSEESKSKRKKNKKKRTDSERSDRAEEIISCTAAFQKLLGSKDGKEDKPVEVTPKEEQPIKQVVEAAAEKETLKPQIPTRDKSTENKNDESGKGKKKNKKDKKHPAKEENEEQVEKSLETKIEPTTKVQTVTAVIEESVAPAVTESCKLEVEKPITPTPSVHKEKSPKPKAKIAKPVEKKRKDAQDSSSTENLPEKGFEEKSTLPAVEIAPEVKLSLDAELEKKSPLIEPKEEIKPKPEEKEQEKMDAKEREPDIKEEKHAATTKTDLIPIPEGGMGKKRRKSKSPKPKGKQQAEIKEPVVAVVESIPPENITKEKSPIPQAIPVKKEDLSITPENKTKEKSPMPQASPVKKDVSKTPENKTKAKSPMPQAILVKKEDLPTAEIKVEDPKLNLPETKEVPLKEADPLTLSCDLLAPQESTQVKILETPEVTKEQETMKTFKTSAPKEDISAKKQGEKEHLEVSDHGSGKKRKKSPKPQNKPGKIPDTIKTSTESLSGAPKDKTEIENKTTEQTTSAAVTPKDTPQESPQTDSPPDMPILEDIEIRSVKADESEGSACSITPDIQYPRASSQLLDDNNNTVIRDITGTDVKLHIPTTLLDTPLVQGSGETPLPQVDVTQSGVTITEMPPVTDLKSKVLDVNQGMEELRRSIERSLAELSSMEKNEKEAEEQFAKAQAKLEKITEMASKKNEEKKQPPSTEIMKQEKPAEIPKCEEKPAESTKQGAKKITEEPTPITKTEEIKAEAIPLQPPPVTETKSEENKPIEETQASQVPPVPARKDNKGKNKKNKKGRQDFEIAAAASGATAQSSVSSSAAGTATGDNKENTKDTKKDGKSEQSSDKNTQEKGKQQSDTQEKGKQQSDSTEDGANKDEQKKSSLTDSVRSEFEPIENFEDALKASVDENDQEVNKTFEMIASEASKIDVSQNPEINITAPVEDEDTNNDKKEQEKVNPLSQPKNLIGHPDIPARLNRTDYKKEKNKYQTPNTKQATVKIKDAIPVEVTKESKQSQTESKRRFLKEKTVNETITSMSSENEDYIYKYSFRKVFLPNACHVCKKDLKISRVPCNFCNLIFYCSVKHKDEDYSHHQGLCFAVSTIMHLKDQKHIYGDAINITGHEYRLLRMQMIVSCEKVLKRRLVPWEQEALLYPRICADVACREWRQNKLVDCEGCGQISYCSNESTHLPKNHLRWCKSYSLYNKLVVYQQTKGRLEPGLPTRVMAETYQIPEKINEVLASMYEEKIDMTDIQYAALTQIATAPLTAAYCHQLYNNKMNTTYANGVLKKSSFTVHVVGAELQFEADALNKWEVFFLHLRPDVKDLRVVLVGPDLNPSKLPLDLLAKIKLCENCRLNKRRVLFDFQDKKTYYEYWTSDFNSPDLVCAFNPSIQRSSVFNGKDIWPSTIKCITKLKVPFIITSYTMSELQRDLRRVMECSEVEVKTITEPEFNAFASVRPDRNFISDDEMPLLFKNFCFTTVCGAI